MELVKLICPPCKGALVRNPADRQCSACGTPYTQNQGLLSFLTPDERFNESVYEARQIEAWTASAAVRNKIRHSKLLSALSAIRIRFSLSRRRDRILLKEMKPHASCERLILDRGCGGGHYFCEYGRVLGIDPVLPLLKLAGEIYDEVYQLAAWFNNECREKSRIIRLLLVVDKLLNLNFAFRETVNFVLEPLAHWMTHSHLSITGRGR